jgi:hypothetical protein
MGLHTGELIGKSRMWVLLQEGSPSLLGIVPGVIVLGIDINHHNF